MARVRDTSGKRKGDYVAIHVTDAHRVLSGEIVSGPLACDGWKDAGGEHMVVVDSNGHASEFVVERTPGV